MPITFFICSNHEYTVFFSQYLYPMVSPLLSGSGILGILFEPLKKSNILLYFIHEGLIFLGHATEITLQE